MASVLTKLTVRNFKRWEEAEIELGNPVVFVGPNDSGKTSALQALALWDLGLRRWIERRGLTAPPQRPGVTVNRRDLVAMPAPSARQLWRELSVRTTSRDAAGSQRTENIRIDIVVDGVTSASAPAQQPGGSLTSDGAEPVEQTLRGPTGLTQPGGSWSCGLEFDFANAESFYCRPLRLQPDGGSRMPVPVGSLRSRVALLGPMSGLAANERRLEIGAVNVLVGEGRTAEVLRNLCFEVWTQPDGPQRWEELAKLIAELFGARLDEPRHLVDRGEIELTYRTRGGSSLDLTSSGRGMQQTLLLLAFLELNPGSVVLLDEPDAHLEILRQRQAFELLSNAAARRGTQVIVASHSEVILNEAAERATVVAFVGTPHLLNKGSEVIKALGEIGFEQYYQAEHTGSVLYLEGSTDLAILQAFAERLAHPARAALERPFVRYVGNRARDARRHFAGLSEAKPDLVGFALFDRLESPPLKPLSGLLERRWRRREIENYLAPQVSLRRFAQTAGGQRFAADSMFADKETQRWIDAMDAALEDNVPPAALRDDQAAYWDDTKISDHFLAPILAAFSEQLGEPLVMRKADYHRLVEFIEPAEVDSDVVEILDGIASQHSSANPAT